MAGKGSYERHKEGDVDRSRCDGGIFRAAYLRKAGADFRILADGARKERLERKGVTVNTINYRFPIITPDVEGDPADLVIIAVKGYDLEQAIRDIKKSGWQRYDHSLRIKWCGERKIRSPPSTAVNICCTPICGSALS